MDHAVCSVIFSSVFNRIDGFWKACTTTFKG